MSLGKKINIQLLLLFWPLAELALLCLFLFLSFDFYYSWGKPYSFSIPPEQYFNILLALPLYALAHFFIFYDWKAKKMRSLFLQRAEPALALGLRSLGAFSLFTLIISLIAVYRGQALSLGVILIFLCILSIIFFYEEIYKYLSSHLSLKPKDVLRLRPLQKRNTKYPKFSVLIILLLFVFPLALNLSHKLKVKASIGYRKINSLYSLPKEDIIQIHIKKKSFRKIKASVRNSLDLSIIVPQEKRFYKAFMEYGGQKAPIKIRLKGDWTDHVDEERHWSFYIKLASGHAFRGMREFAIQHPKTRSWLYECYAVRLLRRHDILAPRCGFLGVRVNGQSWGVYLYQEAFNSQLLEAMSRRAGPILKLKEGGLWEDRVKSNIYSRQNNAQDRDWFFIEVEDYLLPTVGFKAKQYQEDETSLKLYAAALRKFNLYRDGSLDANEVLDLPAYAKYRAFMSLLGAHHLFNHNRRHYYNPLTARFEPIYYDGIVDRLEKKNNLNPSYILSNIKKRDYLPFLRLLIKNIKEITTKEFAQSLRKKDQEYIKRQLSIIRANFPEYEFDWDLIMGNIKLLRSYFWEYAPGNAFKIFSHESHLDKASALLRVWASNYTAWPIELLRFEYRNSKGSLIPLAITNKKNSPLCDSISCLVQRDSERKVAEYRHFDLKIPFSLLKRKINVNDLKVTYKFLGAEKEKNIFISRRIYYNKEELLKPNDYSKANIERQAQKHSFLLLSKKKRLISFKQGSWKVKEDIRIPRGYQVLISGGTLLRFARNAAFISHSPLRIQGSRSQPVVFKALGNSWEGLAVYGQKDKKQRSFLRALIVKDARGYQRPGLQLTGGVTFYKTFVDIIDCSFSNSKGEDMLNMINSQFSISNSRFEMLSRMPWILISVRE